MVLKMCAIVPKNVHNGAKNVPHGGHSVNLVSNLCAYFSYVLFNLVLLYRTNLKAKTYVNIINIPGVKLMCVFLVCAF